MAVNKFIGIGNLGRDPELRTFPDGNQSATISIGMTDRWKDKTTGEQKEHTEWVNVQFGGGLAAVVANYLRKGSKVYVEGRIQTKKKPDQNGVDRYFTSIRGEQMQMLDKRPEGQQTPPPQAQPAQAPQTQGSGFDDMGDDVPW